MSKNHWLTRKAKSIFTITGYTKELNKPDKKTMLEKLDERSKKLIKMNLSNLRGQLNKNIKVLPPKVTTGLSLNENINNLSPKSNTKGLSLNNSQNPIFGIKKNNKNKTSKPNPKPWTMTRRAKYKVNFPNLYSEQQRRLNLEKPIIKKKPQPWTRKRRAKYKVNFPNLYSEQQRQLNLEKLYSEKQRELKKQLNLEKSQPK